MTSQPAVPPASLSDTDRAALNLIWTAVDALTDMESQDRSLALEMSQQMLSDFLNDGHIGDMRNYIHRYCTVYDSAAEADAIADSIRPDASQGTTPA